MIKVNSKTKFTEQRGKYTLRFSVDITPDNSYNPLNFYFEAPLTKEQYTTIKESTKPGNKLNINIEGILEAMASVQFEKKSERS